MPKAYLINMAQVLKGFDEGTDNTFCSTGTILQNLNFVSGFRVLDVKDVLVATKVHQFLFLYPLIYYSSCVTPFNRICFFN